MDQLMEAVLIVDILDEEQRLRPGIGRFERRSGQVGDGGGCGFDQEAVVIDPSISVPR